MLRADLAERGAQAAAEGNRTGAVECGREMHRWCRLVENFFCNPKPLRRIATRCGKTASSYRGMIHGSGLPGARVIVHRP